MLSCIDEPVYQNQIDLNKGEWNYEKNLQFEFQIEDTSETYNLIYLIRNGLDYPYYNLYLRYTLKDSVGNNIDQRLQELILMDKKTGKPLGRGFGDKYDHQFVSLRNYKFENLGKYYLYIDHYMRKENLPEIYSVGLKVIKTEK